MTAQVKSLSWTVNPELSMDSTLFTMIPLKSISQRRPEMENSENVIKNDHQIATFHGQWIQICHDMSYVQISPCQCASMNISQQLQDATSFTPKLSSLLPQHVLRCSETIGTLGPSHSPNSLVTTWRHGFSNMFFQHISTTPRFCSTVSC